MSDNFADLMILAALAPMMILMAGMLAPFGLVAMSAWRGSRSPRPAPSASPAATGRTPLAWQAARARLAFEK